MVFVVDEGSVFDAPLERVWQYLSSGLAHETAHGHRRVERVTLSDTSGEYSWEVETELGRVRHALRWVAFVPVGLAYAAVRGPFAGSTFFQIYTPQGDRTAVSVLGEFTSPTLPADSIESEVRAFFGKEFEEDAAAIRSWRPRR